MSNESSNRKNPFLCMQYSQERCVSCFWFELMDHKKNAENSQAPGVCAIANECRPQLTQETPNSHSKDMRHNNFFINLRQPRRWARGFERSLHDARRVSAIRCYECERVPQLSAGARAGRRRCCRRLRDVRSGPLRPPLPARLDAPRRPRGKAPRGLNWGD